MKPFIIAGIVVAAGLTPVAAQADSWENQVRKQLLMVETTLADSDFFRDGDYILDSMREDSYENHTVRLEKGSTYQFIGVCDNDCSDIDMWIYDENDNEIDSDASADDIPIVNVTPSWTGTFKLRMRMYDCDSEPCRYGIVRMKK